MGKIRFIKTTSEKLLETGEVQETLGEDYGDAVIHTKDEYGEGDNKIVNDNLYIGPDQITDNFIIGESDINTPTRAIGSLGATTIGDLKKSKKTVSQILIDMLKAPVSAPTAPSGKPSLTLSGPSTTIIRVGSTISSESFSVTADRGRWSNNNYYAGTYKNDTNYTITPGSFNSELEEGIYTVKATGTFNSGSNQHDNYGNTVNGYVGGSTVTSNAIKLYVVKPIKVNTQDITEMTEQTLKDYLSTNAVFTVNIPGEDDDLDKKFRISLPGTFTTFKVEQYNPEPLNTWTDISSRIKPNVSGPDDGYYTYIRTTDVTNTQGPTTYRITLKR